MHASCSGMIIVMHLQALTCLAAACQSRSRYVLPEAS